MSGRLIVGSDRPRETGPNAFSACRERQPLSCVEYRLLDAALEDREMW